MRFDYHMHTPLCHHATGHPREYVEAGRRLGLDEIGFSDHNPMPEQFDDWRMGPDELPQYLALIDEARASHPGFPIRLGLECDFIPGQETHIRKLAAATEWDYLIGSVHYIQPDWDVDNPFRLSKWKDYPVEEVWTRYFKAYTQMAQSGLFDFLAHPDLVKKFGFRPEGDLSAYYREALDAIADNGVAMEINTAGLRKDVKEMYPSFQFLKLAEKRGIPILINSDAHAPEEVAFAREEAIQMATEAGYETLTRFVHRQPIASPL